MSTTTQDAPAVTVALNAATAAAEVLPSSVPLTAREVSQGNPEIAYGFAGAATATVPGAALGHVTVLVGSELVEALAASPLEGLDLAAAVQPALDAAAQVLGSSASAASNVELSLVAADLGPFVAVPLGAEGMAGTAAALLISQALLPADPGPAEPAGPDATAGEAATSSLHPQLPPAAPETGAPPARGLELLHGVDLEVTVELGRTRMTVRDLLAITPGVVIELDRAAGSPADLLVNGRLIARGEVVVVDEDFGLRITEIVDAGANG